MRSLFWATSRSSTCSVTNTSNRSQRSSWRSRRSGAVRRRLERRLNWWIETLLLWNTQTTTTQFEFSLITVYELCAIGRNGTRHEFTYIYFEFERLQLFLSCCRLSLVTISFHYFVFLFPHSPRTFDLIFICTQLEQLFFCNAHTFSSSEFRLAGARDSLAES